MQDKRPRLTAFSQNFLGGIQTFYYNLLSNDADNYFNKKWLLLDIKGHSFARPPAPYGLDEIIVEYDESIGNWRNAKKISKNIPDGDGLVLVNHQHELNVLTLYPRPNSVIFHLVHDNGYLPFCKQYAEIIDAYVTHNYELYEDLLGMFPDRKDQIFFLPYGIKLSTVQRKKNLDRKLKITFIGRICTDKGVFDIPMIDDKLKANGIDVDWSIIGNGPEINAFKAVIDKRPNFKHQILATTNEIFEEISTCDIYILPSVLDGTPVSLLESMSVGLVPILYRFNRGIQKVVTDDIGYVIDVGAIDEVVTIISSLHMDRSLLETKAANSLNSAITNFDVKVRSKDYFNLFKRFKDFKRDKSNVKVPQPGITDLPIVPLGVANFYKDLKSKLFSK